MCGRFVASTPVSALAERFLAEPAVEERPARYNVAPTDEVLAVATSRGTRRLGTLSWGLVPQWSTTATPAKRLINLRSETLVDRPGFARLLRERRCIVPADGFYEWRATGGGRRPFLIRARDGSPLAMAGLWDRWADRHDGAPEPLRTCTVLTCAPNATVALLHDRMPVLLSGEAVEAWLDPGVDDVGFLASLLGPCDDDLLELVPVSTAVNSVRNDGPELIERVESPVQGDLLGI
ncbi:MAG TPA: SOS response-associated peptidase [Acidimicrobiales bacterium]|nr:SOS response-associated peptidase [Acidimicrobiales bacterium]